MSSGMSKVLIVVTMAIILIVTLTVFLLPSGDNPDGKASYDRAEGIVTLAFEEPLIDAAWTADVYYERSDTGSRAYVVKDVPVVLSSDKMNATIVDLSLINLQNDIYYLEVSAPSQTVRSISFLVTDHEYSGDDIAVMALASLFFIIAIGFLVVRRLIFGGRMSWSWSRRLH